MVKAGLTKLLKLEKDFAAIDVSKHPKMLIICEDTSVTPLVEDFLKSLGLARAKFCGWTQIAKVNCRKRNGVSCGSGCLTWTSILNLGLLLAC